MKQAKINGIRSDFYYVSEDGNVFSRRKDGSFRKLTPYLTHDGYRRVQLAADIPRKHYRVCRIVSETYLPNLNNLPMVNHKNNIRDDDRVKNLEWCDNSHNQKQRFKHLDSTSNKPVMQICPKTLEVVARHRSIEDASRSTDIQPGNIGKVCRGERNHAGGFQWEFADERI